jgi:putative ABC transport system ATP-binding protein
LGGLTPATSGEVRINGRDLAGMSNSERTDLRKTAVGFVFQKYNLLPTLSAEDNIRIVQYIADGVRSLIRLFRRSCGYWALRTG